MQHHWETIGSHNYICRACGLQLCNSSPRHDDVVLANIAPCSGDLLQPMPADPRALRRFIRQQLANSIRLQYDLSNAAVPLRTAAGRARRCCRCEHYTGDCCDLSGGSCAERRSRWIKAIVAGPDASWCPLLTEEAAR